MFDKIPNVILQAINANTNISHEYKNVILTILNEYYKFFSKLGISVQEENLIQLFSTLSIDLSNEEEIHYDLQKNKIVGNLNELKNGNDSLYNICYSVLDIMCKRYNFDTKDYNDGITFKDESNTLYGTKINNKLKEYIVELSTRMTPQREYNDDYYFDSPTDNCTLDDRIIYDIQQYINYNNLLTYFINGEGILFFNDLCKKFNSSDECIEYLSTIDKYNRENSIESRKKYDELVRNMIKTEDLKKTV